MSFTLPLKKDNIFPKSEENILAVLNFYFDVPIGEIDFLLEEDFTINQIEFIAKTVSKYTFYLDKESGITGNSASNFMKYGIDAMTKSDFAWNGSKNRKRITTELKKMIFNKLGDNLKLN